MTRPIPTARFGGHSDIRKDRGSDRKVVYCWHATKANGDTVHYCSHKTPETPLWCRKHRWASSEPCEACA